MNSGNIAPRFLSDFVFDVGVGWHHAPAALSTGRVSHACSIGGWMDSRAGLNAVEKRIFALAWNRSSIRRSSSPYSGHHTELSHITKIVLIVLFQLRMIGQ